MHQLPCDWNFRHLQCKENRSCDDAMKNGISALHGNNLSFTENGYEQLFGSIFQTFMESRLTSNFDLQEFINRLKLMIQIEKGRRKQSGCRKMAEFEDLVLRRLQQKLKN
jgi:hypothetical protein